MKIDAVGVKTSNMKKTVEFYSILGFDFSDGYAEGGHVEPKTPDGSARLMIDKSEIIVDIIGEEPKPSNHSQFAINYDSAEEVNKIAEELKNKKFTLVKEPWDAFWGQRYCVVEDPDGYRIDLYARL